MAEWIFLDHHIRPRPTKKQIEAWSKAATDSWWTGPTGSAVEKMGDLLDAQDHHLTLAGGKAEAHFAVLNNHYVDSIRQTGRTHILTLAGEQPTILKAIKRLEKFEVQGKILPQQQLTAKDLDEVLRARSSLLSISWAHPETGVIQPIHDLIALCKAHNVKIHLDVSFAVGKLFFQLSELDVDFLTLDGTLLGLPVEMGAIFSKEKLYGMRAHPHPYYAALSEGLSDAFAQIDHYAMEVGRLRARLEEKIEAKILYQEKERLPNTVIAQFEGIHQEKLLAALKQQGLFASKASCDPSALAFTLSNETTQEQIERAIAIINEEAKKLTEKKFVPFDESDAKAKGMRVTNGVVKDEERGRFVSLSLLIDEEDGVIADCRYDVFGPLSLDAAAKATSQLLMRKNYIQAKRLTADLIEKETKGNPKPGDLNLLIDAIDLATESCLDIPVEDTYAAPPDMMGGERTEYPGWEKLSDEQKKRVIDEVMKTDISPYVELDAGGVEVKHVVDNRVTIIYSGNCTSCYSATGATLDAIGNILRHKIFPDLMVIPDMSMSQG